MVKKKKLHSENKTKNKCDFEINWWRKL